MLSKAAREAAGKGAGARVHVCALACLSTLYAFTHGIHPQNVATKHRDALLQSFNDQGPTAYFQHVCLA